MGRIYQTNILKLLFVALGIPTYGFKFRFFLSRQVVLQVIDCYPIKNVFVHMHWTRYHAHLFIEIHWK